DPLPMVAVFAPAFHDTSREVVLAPPGHNQDDFAARLQAAPQGPPVPIVEAIAHRLGLGLLSVLDRVVDDYAVAAGAHDRAAPGDRAHASLMALDLPVVVCPRVPGYIDAEQAGAVLLDDPAGLASEAPTQRVRVGGQQDLTIGE